MLLLLGPAGPARAEGAGNAAPVITGTPPAFVLSRESYEFTPAATDADGDALVFSVENLPPWASFRSHNGKIAGRARHSEVGEYVEIRIHVSDGLHVASLPPFSITVGQGNRRPVIGGTPPAAVVERQAYAFTPSVRDRDGDILTFSIANRPPWAGFDPATGTLSGTPATGTAGSYAGVVISVSDGAITSALAPFAIDVQQGALGSATLSWLPPTTRTDGSPLTNLAGYRLRYGTAPGSYPNTVTIPNAGVTSAVIGDLAPATYHFVVSAYDATGAESANSSPVTKTIP
jgi:hypothetical protein